MSCQSVCLCAYVSDAYVGPYLYHLSKRPLSNDLSDIISVHNVIMEDFNVASIVVIIP